MNRKFTAEFEDYECDNDRRSYWTVIEWDEGDNMGNRSGRQFQPATIYTEESARQVADSMQAAWEREQYLNQESEFDYRG